LEALGINLGYLLVQIFMFGIVFVTLRAWIYKPVLAMLEKRRTAIAQGLEDARVAADARANAEEDAKKIIAEAQIKANDVLREATERADKVEHEFRAHSEAELAKMRETSHTEMDQERERYLSELRGQVAILAIAAAQKIIGETLDEKRQHALLNEFFSGVKNGKVVVLEGTDFSGASAEITSALPLSADEQSSVKKDILSRLGAEATISYKVDPAILGGLIVRVGDHVVDGSVNGQLQGLRQSLK
jgi:F-type H+-transporting ATPase subunit b